MGDYKKQKTTLKEQSLIYGTFLSLLYEAPVHWRKKFVFKSALEIDFRNHVVYYDYKLVITGTGNRSWKF